MPLYSESDSSLEEYNKCHHIKSRGRCTYSFPPNQSSISKSLCHKDEAEPRCGYYCNKPLPNMCFLSNAGSASCKSNNRISYSKATNKRHSTKGYGSNKSRFGVPDTSPSWSSVYKPNKKKSNRLYYFQNDTFAEGVEQMKSSIDLLYNPAKVQKSHNLRGDHYIYQNRKSKRGNPKKEASSQSVKIFEKPKRVYGRNRQEKSAAFPILTSTSTDDSSPDQCSSYLNKTFKVDPNDLRKGRIKCRKQMYRKQNDKKELVLSVSSNMSSDETDSTIDFTSSSGCNLFHGQQRCGKREKPTVDKLILVEGEEVFDKYSEESNNDEPIIKKRRRIGSKEQVKRKIINILNQLDSGDADFRGTQNERDKNVYMKKSETRHSESKMSQRSEIRTKLGPQRRSKFRQNLVPDHLRHIPICGYTQDRENTSAVKFSVKDECNRGVDTYNDDDNRTHDGEICPKRKTKITRESTEAYVKSAKKKRSHLTRATTDEDESMNNAQIWTEPLPQESSKRAEKSKISTSVNTEKNCDQTPVDENVRQNCTKESGKSLNYFNPLNIMLASIPIAWLIIKVIATTNNSDFVIEPLFWFGDKSSEKSDFYRPANRYQPEAEAHRGRKIVPENAQRSNFRAKTPRRTAKPGHEIPRTRYQKKTKSSDDVVNDLKKLGLDSLNDIDDTRKHPSYSANDEDFSRKSQIPLDLYTVEDVEDEPEINEKMYENKIHEKGTKMSGTTKFDKNEKDVRDRKAGFAKSNEKNKHSPHIIASKVKESQSRKNTPTEGVQNNKEHVKSKHNSLNKRSSIRSQKPNMADRVEDTERLKVNAKVEGNEASGIEKEKEETTLSPDEKTQLFTNGVTAEVAGEENIHRSGNDDPGTNTEGDQARGQKLAKQDSHAKHNKEVRYKHPGQNDNKVHRDDQAKHDNQAESENIAQTDIQTEEENQARIKRCGRWPNFFFKSCWGV